VGVSRDRHGRTATWRVTPSPNPDPVLVRESSCPLWGLKGFSDEEAGQVGFLHQASCGLRQQAHSAKRLGQLVTSCLGRSQLHQQQPRRPHRLGRS
jgi:hypothetical protein